MSQLTRAQIAALIAADFPDNTSGAITPALLRTVVADVSESAPNILTDGTPATLAGPNAFTGTNSYSGVTVGIFTAMAALAVDMTKWGNSKSLSGDATFTYSAATPTAGTTTRLRVTADASPRTVTIPQTWSLARNGNITSLLVPANATLQVLLQYVGGRWEVIGDPVATTGSGSFVLATAPTISAPVISGHSTIEGVTPTGATGAGKMVFDTSPALVTPALGVATATSVNGVTIPATSDTAALLAAIQKLTNKRVQPRITTISSSATPAVNTDVTDCVTITALGTAITSMSSSLTGTPDNFDQLFYRIKDDGSARAITWGASFASRGATLPTTTVLSKVLYVQFVWNSVTSTWDCVSVANEA